MRIRLHVFASAFVLSVFTVAPIAVAAQPGLSAVAPELLEPGQYKWNAAGVGEGPVEVVVSLSQQVAYVYRSGELIGLSTVSTGTADRPTPTGRFRVLQKKVFHRSNKYDDAPMPHMMRLTWYGVALHAGHNPGYPASHGCIRLPAKFAERLFAIAPLQTTVVVTDESPASPDDALQIARATSLRSMLTAEADIPAFEE